jgi:hypothetical protein
MKAPSSPAAVEKTVLDPTHCIVEALPAVPARRLPLAPVGSWYWLQGQQQKTTSQLTPRSQSSSLGVSRARRLRRCGRNVMLWVLFWYVAFQIAPTLLKDRWQRIGPYYEARKWPALEQLVAENPKRPLLVMVGSSRTAWDFQAGSLDGMPDSDGRPMLVYNFGVPSTGPLFQLFCLRDMLAKGIRPRFVLLEFLPPLLCEARRGVLSEDSMLEYESFTVHRMLQWLPYLRNPKKWISLWLESRIAPCYVFRNYLLTELKCLVTGQPPPRHGPFDDRGWHLALPFISPLAHQTALVAARGGYGPGLMNFRLGKIPNRAIHELLDLCQREKIPAALVLMPEDSHFRSWYSLEAKTAIRNLLDELKQTYGVEVIDAQRWLPDEDFEDGHHALLNGSIIFTKRIRAELPRLLAQSREVKSD